ncbi:MAG: hypothetical protein NC251_01685 [Lachnoclostridium sp.]|nr:hypothetical protein [Lachnospira sp.]MCM1247119.1 hypothetical protein [Lachnoclostridium sp.]
MKRDINANKENNEKGRRIYGLAAAAVCFACAGLLLLLFGLGRSEKAKNITCQEWLEMLCGEFDPERGILELIPDFEEEEYASGSFIALTAVRTIGDNKLQDYLKTEDYITDDDCIELAIECGLIKEKQLKGGLSEEECEQVLENLSSLYFNRFWRDDYSQVTYQKGVVELSAENVLYSDEGGTTLAADAMTDSLEVGDIIVWEQADSRLKIAREITQISEEGILSLKPTQLERVVETLVVSDITEFGFEDIAHYYGWEKEEGRFSEKGANCPYMDRNAPKPVTFRFEASNSGFQLSLATKGEEQNRHLEIEITDNATGVSYTLPEQIEVEADSEYSAKISIDKIAVGAQIKYSALENCFKYADAALDVHAVISGIVKAEEEKTIPLFKTPVPLGNGVAGVDVQINLVLSVEGDISFQAELPMQLAVNYEKGRGFRNTGHGISVENPMLEANCTAGAGLRIEPILVVLGVNVMDVEADIKAQAQAKVQTHSNGQICSDIALALPIVVLSVCGDEEADTILGKLGISAEWEVLSADNAPFQKRMHYEILPDKNTQFVKKCTYGEAVPSDNQPTKPNSLEMKNTYSTNMKEAEGMKVPTFMFDYPDGWEISEGPYVDSSAEFVEWTNDNGVLIRYQYIASSFAYGNPRIEEEAEEISRVADSAFVPGYAKTTDYSDLGKFVVAKIKMGGDSDYYAVIPESECAAHRVKRHFIRGFWYDGYLEFWARIPKDLTPEEEQEIIAILSSFRVADGENITKEESMEDSVLAKLQAGDFSDFEGTYKPYEDNGYGLVEIRLSRSGVMERESVINDYSFIDVSEQPVLVTKNEDGSYQCRISYQANNSQEYFVIYPKGVIGDDGNRYGFSEDFLIEAVYIRYVHMGGGVMDVIACKVEDE